MAENDSVSGAAGTGVNFKVGGKDIKFTALTIRDLAEFESYVKSKSLKAFMAIADRLPPEERMQIIERLASNPPPSMGVLKEMMTMEGVAFLLWRTAMKTEPGITLEEASSRVNLQNFKEIGTVIQAVSGVDEENPTARGASPEKSSDGISS